jgi:hypothetical protein
MQNVLCILLHRLLERLFSEPLPPSIFIPFSIIYTQLPWELF